MELLFIRRFLGIDAKGEPVSRIGKILKRAVYVRDLEVDVVARAIAEVLGDA